RTWCGPVKPVPPRIRMTSGAPGRRVTPAARRSSAVAACGRIVPPRAAPAPAAAVVRRKALRVLTLYRCPDQGLAGAGACAATGVSRASRIAALRRPSQSEIASHAADIGTAVNEIALRLRPSASSPAYDQAPTWSPTR